jgi:ribosomal protein S18 acetylase RimI-like enzyme
VNISVREATTDDIARVAVLFDAYRVFYGQNTNIHVAQFYLAERVKRGESKIFIAIDADTHQTVGFTQLYPGFSSIRVGRIWILEDLFVRADVRRGGVGEALMTKAEAFAKESGAIGITLSTAATNANAQRLYERHGFERDEAFLHYSLYF